VPATRSSAAAAAEPVLSRRHAAGAPSARGLLFTLLGEFVLPGDGTAWTSAVLAVLGRLGIEEKATRQALPAELGRIRLKGAEGGRRGQGRVIRRAPAAGAGGFRREEFRAASKTSSAIIFICPYGTSISTVRWAIGRLRRDGYHVVAYETASAVFMAGDPSILPDLIAAVRTDITSQVSRLRSEGVTDLGFFGSSLGSFILYNCIGDALPDLRWGVFNTGGDIAQGMWRLDGARRQHVMRGWSLARLEAAWAGLQWPEFGRLDGCRFIFVSSRRDTIAPLDNITQYLEPIRRAGAQVSVLKVPAIGHLTTIVAGLWRAPRIVAMVRGQAAFPRR
jgi:hypothetical protein